MFQEFWENAIKPAAEALSRREFEDGTRVFMDGAMSKGYFDQLPKPIRESMMDNAKAFLKQVENPMPMDFNIQELKKISAVPTLFVKGDRSPKLFHRIVDILAQQLPRAEQVTIQEVTHDLGRASKAEVFNSKVIEFLTRN